MKTLEALDPRYLIRSPLRCDGVGSLDCAEDTVTGARMAIRWLPVDANGVAAAQAVKQLPAHPVIPSIRDTGRVGQAAFVAMDFPDGEVLATRAGMKLPLPLVMRLGAELSDALASLHAQNVFHGELSADSVLLLGGNKAILWDLPLVLANRLTDRRGEERLLSQLIRTAAFLAPERARGAPPSAASDVFSLGSILCLLLGGERPKAGSTLELVHRISTGMWRPQVPAELPAHMRTLLFSMIGEEASDRPSARSVADALVKNGASERPAEEVTDPLLGERLEALLAKPPVEAPVLEPTDPLIGERLVPMLEAMKSGDEAVSSLPLPSVMVDPSMALNTLSPRTDETRVPAAEIQRTTEEIPLPGRSKRRGVSRVALAVVALVAVGTAAVVGVTRVSEGPRVEPLQVAAPAPKEVAPVPAELPAPEPLVADGVGTAAVEPAGSVEPVVADGVGAAVGEPAVAKESVVAKDEAPAKVVELTPIATEPKSATAQRKAELSARRTAKKANAAKPAPSPVSELKRPQL